MHARRPYQRIRSTSALDYPVAPRRMYASTSARLRLSLSAVCRHVRTDLLGLSGNPGWLIDRRRKLAT